MRTKIAFKSYVYIRKTCVKGFEDLSNELNYGAEHTLSLDEKIILDTLNDLQSKLEKVIFYIEDHNSRDIDRHTY